MPGLSAVQSCLLRLNAALAPRPGLLLQALARFGPRDIFKASAADLAETVWDAGYFPWSMTIEGLEAALERARRVDAEAEAERAEKAGVSLLFHGEPGYPELLQETEDSPLALYVKGRLREGAHPLAFVGSRHPTAYGLRMAARLCHDAAAAGYCVVSGLARGIDTQAHEAALRAEGLTWAVLGSGLDRIYPAENRGLSERILLAGGTLVSEFPMGAPPLDHHFPRRNRIISGLCWATVVVEGRIKSGSIITAKAAVRQGRGVLAVPGPADSPLYEASHHLLSSGAAPAARLADIIACLPPGAQPPERSLLWRGRQTARGFLIRNEGLSAVGPGPSLPSEHRKILQSLSSDSLTLDELGQSTGLDFFRLSTIIFELEMQDLISLLPGQRYAKKGN